MTSLRRTAGTAFLRWNRLASRAHGKAFSVLAAGGFASFGQKSVLQPPLRLSGERRIRIGAGVFVGAGSWLQVLDGHEQGVAIELGDGTSIAGACVISAVASVKVGRDVLIARNVYIADHQHAFADPDRPVLAQGVTRVEPVSICDGAWLGQNVVVGPGVRVGRGSVVGAGAVVLTDVPDFAVAVGAPARVVRRFGRSTEPGHLEPAG